MFSKIKNETKGKWTISIGGNAIRRIMLKYQTLFEVKLMLNVNQQTLEKAITEQQS